MGLFSQKKKDNPTETTEKPPISEVELKLKELDRRIFSLEMDYDLLRNKVLRKIQFKKEEQQHMGGFQAGKPLKQG